MILIFCTDKNGGLYFNNRRQSSDKLVYKRIKEITADKKLYTGSYSYQILEQNNIECLVENNVSLLLDEDVYYFCEITDVNSLCNKCDKIIIYNWNRDYPYDIKLDKSMFNFIVESEFDFEGNSHDKITETIYSK